MLVREMNERNQITLPSALLRRIEMEKLGGKMNPVRPCCDIEGLTGNKKEV